MESNIANSELPISIHDCGLEDNFKYNDFIVPELKSEQIIIPDVGNAIPVDLVLESLFGNNNIDFPRLDFLRMCISYLCFGKHRSLNSDCKFPRVEEELKILDEYS